MRPPGEQVTRADRVEQVLELRPQAVRLPDGGVFISVQPVSLREGSLDREFFRVQGGV